MKVFRAFNLILLSALVGCLEAQSQPVVDDDLKNEFIDVVAMTGKIFYAQQSKSSLAKKEIKQNNGALAELDKKLFKNLLNVYRKGQEHAHLKGDPNLVQIEFKATEPFFDEARTLMDEIVVVRTKNEKQKQLLRFPWLEVHDQITRPRMKHFIQLLINAPAPKPADLYVQAAVQQYFDQTPAGESAQMMSAATATNVMQDAINYIFEFVKAQKD